MDTEDINLSILCENHNCRNFDCGDAELNEFLKEDALTNQNKNMSVTWIATGLKWSFDADAIKKNSFSFTILKKH